MNTFASAVGSQLTVTENGMPAYKETGDKVLNFFSSVGARRGQDNIPLFAGAFGENQDLALRAALWSRDVRGGAGERETFRQILKYLVSRDFALAKRMMAKVPEVGRWDDLIALFGTTGEAYALELIEGGLKAQNGLCAKWMPRKGANAEKIRAFMGYTPKQYRKTLVNLTRVVEQQMCAQDWNSIELQKVPSLAGIRYRKAFTKHIPHKVQKFASAVASGEVKVNAGAVYPHQIVKQLKTYGVTSDERKILEGQWRDLENYVPEGSYVLPMVDVSGSMDAVSGDKSSTCMDIAVALGLYLADKNTGPFKDLFLTFSTHPELVKLAGNTLTDKINQMQKANWDMSTNVMAAFELILKTAKNGKVPQEQMPQTVMIFSDMQFDQCATYNETAYKNICKKFNDAGYNAPKVVFWNLRDVGNKAAQRDDIGCALVSGFSPSLMKNTLSNKIEVYTPFNVMVECLMNERYNY